MAHPSGGEAQVLTVLGLRIQECWLYFSPITSMTFCVQTHQYVFSWLAFNTQAPGWVQGPSPMPLVAGPPASLLYLCEEPGTRRWQNFWQDSRVTGSKTEKQKAVFKMEPEIFSRCLVISHSSLNSQATLAVRTSWGAGLESLEQATAHCHQPQALPSSGYCSLRSSWRMISCL